jgi:hypothetical protein
MADTDDALPPADSVLSDRDERLLNYLALVAQVLQRQVNPPQTTNEKTFRAAFREPTVVATLITVLIGGIAATLITGIIQWRAGIREFDQTWLKSRGDQALVSYKEYLDQEQAFMKRTYSLIGACVSASDRLVSLTKSTWRQRFVGPEFIAVRTQMRDIRQNYNQTNAKWHSEGEELGLLMDYYHPDQPKLRDSWKNVQQSVTNYLDCGEKWHSEHPLTKPAPSDGAVKGACKSQHDSLIKDLNDLTSSLQSARRYASTGWESPQEIRALMDASKPSSPAASPSVESAKPKKDE